jgi:hypothetical protein
MFAYFHVIAFVVVFQLAFVHVGRITGCPIGFDVGRPAVIPVSSIPTKSNAAFAWLFTNPGMVALYGRDVEYRRFQRSGGECHVASNQRSTGTPSIGSMASSNTGTLIRTGVFPL